MNEENKPCLKEKFLSLLDKEDREQVYQDFMEKNTQFIPRNFIQNHGVHCSLVFRKISLGADYKPDFFMLSKSSVDWNAIFIEIEKPSSKFFKKGSSEIHQDFQRGINQIKTWKAWLASDENKNGFLASLNNIRVPSHMAKNPTYCKYVLVHGRRSEFEKNPMRASIIKSNEDSDFKIMSFDSLAEGEAHHRILQVAIRKNNFFDLMGDDVVDESIFSWVDPSHLRVSENVWKKLNGGSESRYLVSKNDKYVDAWKNAASTVRVRKD